MILNVIKEINLESIMLVFILIYACIFVIELTLVKILMRIRRIENKDDSSK